MNKIAEFNKDDVIPEWLVEVEGIKKENVTFGTDVEVFEDEDYRYVYPKGEEYYCLMRISNGDGNSVVRATKETRWLSKPRG